MAISDNVGGLDSWTRCFFIFSLIFSALFCDQMTHLSCQNLCFQFLSCCLQGLLAARAGPLAGRLAEHPLTGLGFHHPIATWFRQKMPGKPQTSLPWFRTWDIRTFLHFQYMFPMFFDGRLSANVRTCYVAQAINFGIPHSQTHPFEGLDPPFSDPQRSIIFTVWSIASSSLSKFFSGNYYPSLSSLSFCLALPLFINLGTCCKEEGTGQRIEEGVIRRPEPGTALGSG